MNGNNKIYTTSFNYIEFDLPLTCIKDCSHSGQCDDDVSYWKNRLNLQIDSELLRRELKEYGAWNSEELSNHDDNLLRIIWIAAGNLRDENNL